jgi:hypothetical protein
MPLNPLFPPASQPASSLSCLSTRLLPPASQPAPQDFEALTPNLLARTVETVEGGGCVVLLLSSLQSLTQLYTLTMDVHARLRTEAHADVTGVCGRGAEDGVAF